MWLADGPKRTVAGHVVPRSSRQPGLRCLDHTARLEVGLAAVVAGDIQHRGAVCLAKGAVVQGDIHAGHEALIGARCHTGRVVAEGRIVIQDGTRTGDLRAGGDVVLVGTCQVGHVQAGGDIIIVGSPKTGRLEPGGRVTTRSY